jgi:PAS domain-containing protein
MGGVIDGERKMVSSDQLPLKRAARGEASTTLECWCLHDGKRVDVLGTAVPPRDETGSVRGAIGAFVDITQRKQP